MIVITGCSSGIGKALCEHFHKARIEVIGLSRTELNEPYRTYVCDVTNPDNIKSIVKTLRKEHIIVLINAAGIASMNLAITTPTEVTKQIIETNLLGTIYCCQLFSPLIIRNKPGVIINFSTIAVSIGLKGESIYVASKAGVEGFTRSFAKEMADFDVTVNCIAPGPIDTKLIKGLTEKQITDVVNRQSITKQFTVNTVCDIVDILIDTKSRSLTGQVFNIGGI